MPGSDAEDLGVTRMGLSTFEKLANAKGIAWQSLPDCHCPNRQDMHWN
jgi:hypothetical protein